jgi:tetratricopeptide (TPR) repeat protein
MTKSWPWLVILALSGCAPIDAPRPPRAKASVCRDFEQDIEEVWSSERRARVTGKAGGLAFGREVVLRVSTELDAFQRSWVMMKESACTDCLIRAALPKSGYNRIATCLDTVLARQRTLVTVLDAARPEQLAHADAMMSAISQELQACRDAAVSAAFDHGLDAAGDGDEQPEFHALRVALAEVESQLDLLEFEAARDGASQGIAEARRLGHARHEAKARHLRARALSKLGLMQESLAETYRAEPLVRGDVDPHLLVEILMTRAHVLSRMDRVFEAVDTARDALRRAEATPETELHARALAGLGLVLDTSPMREQSEVLQYFHHARSIYTERLGPESLEVSDTLGFEGMARGRSGEFEEALSLFERQLDLLEARLGIDHPDLSDPLSNIAITLMNLGRREEALAKLERAYELRLEVFGEQHPAVSGVLLNIGVYHGAGGDHAKALLWFERAYQSVATIAPDSAEADAAGFAAAQALRMLGRPSEAELWYERLRVVHHDRGDFARECFALEGLAGAAYEQGHHAEAIADLEQAIRIRELAMDESPVLAAALGVLGKIQLEAGTGDAIASLARARSILAEWPDAELQLRELDLLLEQACTQSHVSRVESLACGQGRRGSPATARDRSQ